MCLKKIFVLLISCIVIPVFVCSCSMELNQGSMSGDSSSSAFEQTSLDATSTATSEIVSSENSTQLGQSENNSSFDKFEESSSSSESSQLQNSSLGSDDTIQFEVFVEDETICWTNVGSEVYNQGKFAGTEKSGR